VGLFGFAPLAGLLSLTLPAGHPPRPRLRPRQRQPLALAVVSWALFGVRFRRPGAGLPAVLVAPRAHRGDQHHLIFGPLLPGAVRPCPRRFLLEIGLVTGAAWVPSGPPLATPAGLVVLALLGHRSDAIYQGFLDTFRARLRR